ncbi:MAG: transcription termination factor Rho [Clostridiales bacterium]|nr:transcription termination factor Rho [Eubacterium sp.]MDD7348857.1 transcription termination factor Rho [Clostridiales bacterium]
MDFTKLSLKELREMAKEKGLSKVSGLRKAELIEELKKAEILSQSVVRPVKPVETPETKKAEPKVERKPIQEKKNEPEKEKKVYTYVPSQNNTRNNRGRGGATSHSTYQGNNYSNSGAQSNVQNQSQNYSHTGPQEMAHQEPATEIRNESHGEVLQEPIQYRTIEEVIRAGLITIAKDRHVLDVHPTEIKELDSGITKKGILEIMPEGYGFIRCDNFLPGDNDVYVSPAFLRRFGLRTGDIIEGNLRVRTQNEKFSALLYMTKVNERPITYLAHRNKFEELTPIFPNKRIHLETDKSSVSMRMLDLIAPIGKGQRGMIVSQPKTGKTTLLKQVASAITHNYPEMHLLILLIDERPEEVTDIKESIAGEKVEVIYSTFDELPENHKRVSEMVIERAKRLVEGGDDVVVLLDSITRLARAYNLTVTPSGRTLSGGLDPAALHMPKRFFGAARNMREGGSLTVLATALVDTGSRMDDVVFEEFKGTGNMELVLDRHLSEKRVFPAIDIQKSSTRREDLLLSQDELEAVYIMRKALGSSNTENNLEQIINLFRRTKNNKEFIETIKKIKLH